MALPGPAAHPASTRAADKTRIAVHPRHNSPTLPSADTPLPAATAAAPPSTTQDENRNRARTTCPATPAAAPRCPPPRRSATIAAFSHGKLRSTASSPESSRHKLQRVCSLRRYRCLTEWPGEGRAPIPVRPLVAVVCAQRITRLAHHDVLRRLVHIAPVNREPLRRPEAYAPPASPSWYRPIAAALLSPSSP